ncbi:fungal-specific transcription factor domain-containing protein [Ilyonectria destructans]|nr:fungal-specific transcription factor domain-containing protein [Ilyonectria destructans]
MAPATPQSNQTRLKSRHFSTARLRAPKACLPCRTRKVRCDVTIRGSPCTNCFLDGKNCATLDRASRRGRISANYETEYVPCSPCPNTATDDNDDTEGQGDSQVPNQSPQPLSVDVVIGMEPEAQHTPDCEASPQSLEEQPHPARGVVSSGPEIDALECLERDDEFGNLHYVTTPCANDTDSWRHHIMDSQPISTLGQMPYSSCKFLDLNNLSRLPSQDRLFIEAKGCLHIPVKPLMDEFVRQYFLNIHPFLPILDEGSFWKTYQQEGVAGSCTTISLLVFQAMLFASCGSIAPTVIRALGFKSIRSARASFYHKAKLLYDFNTEASSISIAQAAVLMTFWASPETQPTDLNTMWLKIALHHAKCVGAHRAWESSSGSNAAISHSQQYQRMLKRLWWSCMIRDRFLSIGLRRSLQIRRPYPVLYVSDFQSEIGRSEVHRPETKRHLISILLRLMDLCNTLTELLLLVSSLEDSFGVDRLDVYKLTKCRSALQSWHAKTNSEIPFANSGSGLRQHSIIIYTNTMYIFYYASRIVLIHQEILLSCSEFGIHQPISPENYSRSQEAQEANLGMTRCLRELMELDLIRYLPLSILAFTALPLFLHVLDIRFVSSGEHTAKSATNHHHLQILIEAMKVYQPRYDGVEWVSYAVRVAVDLAQPTLSSNALIKGWRDLLVQQPSLYLRLTLSIDLSLSQLKIPDEQDFPLMLRGVLSPDTRLLRGPFLDIDEMIQHPQEIEPQITSHEVGTLPNDHTTLERTSAVQHIDLLPLCTQSVIVANEPLSHELDLSRNEEPATLAFGDVLFTSPHQTTLDTSTNSVNRSDDVTLSNEFMESMTASCTCNEAIDFPSEIDMFINFDGMDYRSRIT